MYDLDTDLSTRWTPSEEQDLAAIKALSSSLTLDHVFTLHMLVHKNYGWWAPGVKVVPLTDTVYTTREDALKALEVAAAAAREISPATTFTMGFTRHRRPGHEQPQAAGRTWRTGWAVFEDILATNSGDGDN